MVHLCPLYDWVWEINSYFAPYIRWGGASQHIYSMYKDYKVLSGPEGEVNAARSATKFQETLAYIVYTLTIIHEHRNFSVPINLADQI